MRITKALAVQLFCQKMLDNVPIFTWETELLSELRHRRESVIRKASRTKLRVQLKLTHGQSDSLLMCLL